MAAMIQIIHIGHSFIDTTSLLAVLIYSYGDCQARIIRKLRRIIRIKIIRMIKMIRGIIRIKMISMKSMMKMIRIISIIVDNICLLIFKKL